jgi:hypothetical protein
MIESLELRRKKPVSMKIVAMVVKLWLEQRLLLLV